MGIQLDINGTLNPTTSGTPTHVDIHGKGGYITVDTYSELTTRHDDMNSEGMLAYVGDEDTIYKWGGESFGWTDTISSNILTIANSVEDLVDVTDKGSGAIISTLERVTYDGYGDAINSFQFDYVSNETFTDYRDGAPSANNIIKQYPTISEMTNDPLTPSVVYFGAVSFVIENNNYYKLTSFADDITITNAQVSAVNGVYTFDGSNWETNTGGATEYRIVEDTGFYSIVDIATPTIDIYTVDVSSRHNYPPPSSWTNNSTGIIDDDMTFAYTSTWTMYYIMSAYATTVPANQGSVGIEGQYAYDATHKYECIATDVWVRFPIETTFTS